ncbi:MAG: XrtA system polysaccharide deacetylase [Telluria sp.]
MRTIRNALTCDVEDYFQVSAFERHIPRARWDQCESRIERNLYRVLDLLSERGLHGTFFVLGWLARRHPHLVRELAGRGHEVASHGYAHERATAQSPAQFRCDVRAAKQLLEDLAGSPVHGYRAPSFSIGAANHWAHEVLHEAGYRYSSSVYPIRHDHYGMPAGPRFCYRSHGLLEIPVSTALVGNARLPAGGGGYFRLFPYALSRGLLARVHRRDAQPAVFYFHPWELDPAQPRTPGLPLRTHVRHYLNLGRTEARLRRLLADFAWDRVDQVFPEAA